MFTNRGRFNTLQFNDKGLTAAEGSSEITVLVSSSASGFKTALGGSEIVVIVSAEASGRKTALGGSEIVVIVSAEASGRKTALVSTSEIEVIAETQSGGFKQARSPPTETDTEIVLEGGGQKATDGGTETEAIVSAAIAALKAASGSTETTSIVDTLTDGFKTASNSSELSLELTTSASGFKTALGGDEVSVIVSNESSGVKLAKGASEIVLEVVCETEGIKATAGSSLTGIVVSCESGGKKNAVGSGEIEQIISLESECEKGALCSIETTQLVAVGSDGFKTTSGASEVVVVVNAETAGGKAVQGSSETASVVTYEAEGIKNASGSVESVVEVSGEAHGTASRCSGVESSVVCDAESSGFKAACGSKETIVEVGSENSATTTRSGSIETSLVLSLENLGVKKTSGSKETTVVIGLESSGQKTSSADSEIVLVVSTGASGWKDGIGSSTSNMVASAFYSAFYIQYRRTTIATGQINNIRKKGRLLTPARKESKSSEVSPDPAAIKQEDTGAQKAKSEVQNKLDMIDRTVDAMVPVLFDKAKDSKVFVPVTRQDVMDALRKLRTAGGAAYKLVSPVEEGSFKDKNGNKKTGAPDVKVEPFKDKNGNKKTGAPDVKVEPTGTVNDYPDTIDIVFGGRQTDPYLFDVTTISVYKKNNGIREPVSGITVVDDTGTSNHSDPVNVPVFGSEVVIYVTEFLVKITMTITRKKRVNIVPEDYYEIVPRYIFRTETEYLGDYTPGTVNNNGEGGFIKTPVKEPTNDYQIPKLEVNDMPQDWITEDDYRYAMDIIKISLPNSLAVQEDADMMPSFEGDSVNFGDKVFVGDDETLSYTEDELSKVERKPCRPKINWFLYFLLGVLMSEDETIDMAWVIGHFILCPIQTFFNIYWFLPIKNALKGLGLLMGLIPGVRALLFAIADALPYIYLVEEGMYAIAKKKADTVCRKLVLAKKYSCLLFSEEYFMKGKENDWIAKQIVTEISSEEIDVLRKSTAYQHLVSDDRQKSISLSNLVYNRKNLFKNHEYPEPDAINSAMEQIGEFASVSFDLFMVMGANLTADFASSYKTNNQKEIDRSLKKMCKRLTKVFNMESSNDIAYVVNSIENFRLNTNEYFIYDDTDFPEEYCQRPPAKAGS